MTAVFHGAGLEVNILQARGMLDAAYGLCAWVLFPSGITSWNGDDWRKSDKLADSIAGLSGTRFLPAPRLLGHCQLPGYCFCNIRVGCQSWVGGARGTADARDP